MFLHYYIISQDLIVLLVIKNKIMGLKNKVVSLRLAQKMKTLGFKQDSLFSWVQNHDGKTVVFNYSGRDFVCSAYLAEEVGKILPDYTSSLGNLEISKCDTDHISMKKHKKGWWNVSYWSWKNAYTNRHNDIYLKQENKHLQQAKTMANTLAKMAIYLKENKLI